MNLETINKWLDEEYGCSYTKLEKLHDFYFKKYTDLQQENQKLKIQISARETAYNNLENNWNKLKEHIMNDINSRSQCKVVEYEGGRKVMESTSSGYILMQDKSTTAKEILHKMQEMEKNYGDMGNNT